MTSKPLDTQSEEIEETEDVPPAVADIAATFVNAFYVAVSDEFTRIAFAETLDGNPSRYRWAVVLPTKEARDLAKILTDLTAPGPPASPELDEEE
jgi:hypothetical protein